MVREAEQSDLDAILELYLFLHEDNMKKEYSHDLLEKYKNDIGQVSC